jgi:iron(III) transport system substrate-binding protein
MSVFLRTGAAAAAAITLAACGGGSDAPDAETGAVNLFTARHYSSDEAVYAAFTDQTGIEVNVIEAPGDLLIERIRADGARSQADVVITVDAGRLWRAEQADLFQPAPELEETLSAVPATLRHPEGDWFGFASRVRGVAYAADRVDPADIQDFTALADEAWRGRICVRSSNNVYNQSLLAGLIESQGEEAAEAWAAGIVANLARAPQGGDTDQIRAIAAGECDVAIVNHYYLARLERSDDPADQEVAEAVDLVIADLAGQGAHVNISGAGLAAGAPNRDNAVRFLEFLLSEEAQRAFAELTNEYPVIEGAAYENPVLDGWGEIDADPVNVNALGANAGQAQRIFDRVGWP